MAGIPTSTHDILTKEALASIVEGLKDQTVCATPPTPTPDHKTAGLGGNISRRPPEFVC